MKIELIYVLESAGEIKCKSGDAEDVIRKFNETYNELHEKAKAEGDYCNSFKNGTNKYFLEGSISASIDNKSYYYKLRTEVRKPQRCKSITDLWKQRNNITAWLINSGANERHPHMYRHVWNVCQRYIMNIEDYEGKHLCYNEHDITFTKKKFPRDVYFK